MLVRLIAAKWAAEQGLTPEIIEGDLSFDEILERNAEGYNAYTWPNSLSDEAYDAVPLNPRTGSKRPIKGSDVDTFRWVFVDFDLKSQNYPDKDTFIAKLLEDSPLLPTRIVDSGNGVHSYWAISDLDAKSFLRLNRRLSTLFNTDRAVTTLNQLMRIPNTLNMKTDGEPKLCEIVWDEPENVYSAEQMDQWLPAITPEDEAYCTRHYDTAYKVGLGKVKVPTELPKRFLDLCKHDKEAASLYYDKQDDRSTADFYLGLHLFNNGFSKDEAMAVMCRTQKALERSPVHQYNYGFNIVEKIWIEEEEKAEAAKKRPTGPHLPITSIAQLMNGPDLDGERIYCNPMIDATERGFRLGDVLGLVGGQGNGKSTAAMNIFRWFTEYNVNKDYIHLFVSLEMPKNEIVKRWQAMAAELSKSVPHVDWGSKVYVLDNYNDDGTYRELGLDEIQEYVLYLESVTGKKVGCLVVDHIGIIKQKRVGKKDSENEGLTGVCKQLKAVAIRTNTFFIVQSQTSRAKNGGGDVELDMDAAFGTSSFESFADFIMTTWQPLKRVTALMDKDRALFVTAFKVAKIRHKNVLSDRIQEGVVYGMVFDPRTGLFREMTSDEHRSYEFWNKKATLIRNKDRKRDPSELVTITWTATKRENGQERAS